VNYEVELYRISRDANPTAFSFERGWQMGTGQEMFTHSTVSRITAAAELVIPMLISAGISRIFKGNVPVPKTAPSRVLTEPIYDLPAEGGGMRIKSAKTTARTEMPGTISHMTSLGPGHITGAKMVWREFQMTSSGYALPSPCGMSGIPS
jgi:hypothetical protein